MAKVMRRSPARVPRLEAAPTSRTWIDWLAFGCRIFVGLIFLLAGVMKIVNPGSFAAALLAYGVLPVEALRPFSLVFPWIEIFIGVYLLAGFFSRQAAWAAIGMLALFCAVIAQALLRGRSLEDCGCFGGITEVIPQLTLILGGSTLGWNDVLRDLAYAAVAAVVVWRGVTPLSVDAAMAARRRAEAN